MTRTTPARRDWLRSACCGGAAALSYPWLLPVAAAAGGQEPPAAAPSSDFCTEHYLSPEQQAEADRLARMETEQNVPLQLPMNDLTPFSQGTTVVTPAALQKLAAAFRAKKWPKGRVLKVAWMGGAAAVHAKVQQFADEWSQFANIRFQYGVPAAQSDVRVSFTLTGQGSGHWSYTGTDVLGIAKTSPTMNLMLTAQSSNAEFSRVVIHEFGHTLGLIHEHQHPDGGISWNKPAVYAYYAQTQNPPWNQAKVDQNIFATYDRSWLQYGVFDRRSIMLYPILAAHVTNPAHAVGWNTVLSPYDKLFIKTLYPA